MESFDTDGMHSTASNTGRITFNTAGKYIVGAHLAFEVNSAGERSVMIQRNGGARIVELTITPSSTDYGKLVVGTIYDMAAGDYIECIVYQTSGANRAVKALTDTSPMFWAARIGA